MARLQKWRYAAVALAMLELGAYLSYTTERNHMMGLILTLFGLAAVLDLMSDRVAKH